MPFVAFVDERLFRRHSLVIVKSRVWHVGAAKAPSSRMLHFLGFHRGDSFFACGNRVHGFVDRCQCILAGQFRFFDRRLWLLVFAGRRGKHVFKHHRKFRGVPFLASLFLLLYIVPDFRVLIRREWKVSKRVARVGVDHDIAPKVQR